jgi:hypothetical protein
MEGEAGQMSEEEEFEFRLRLEQETSAPASTGIKKFAGDTIRQQAKGAGNRVAGLVRGAGSIGETLLAPIDAGARALGIQNDFIGRDDRRQAMTDALGSLGADTNSLDFKGGKLAAEVGGTAGIGGALSKGAQAAKLSPEIVNALRTGGFSTGTNRLSTANNLVVRGVGGGATGAATVGAVSPEDAGAGGAIGAALPGVLKGAGAVGGAIADVGQGAAKGLMESALKGTIKAHKKGDVDTAVQTLLDYGINPTNAGVQKIKGLVSELNQKIETAIQGSTATIDKDKVLNALARSRQTAANQVSPTSDLAAIQGVGDDFTKSFPGPMGVQQAQSLKQGTYRNLSKKYGEQGSATTEAQKDLARGLKDEVAAAVPAVVPLNAAESKLLTTLKVAERRAMMDVNKNPIGLDAALALASGNPVVALGLLANSKAGTKATLARGLNALSQKAPSRLNALSGPAVYRSLPRAGQQNP